MLCKRSEWRLILKQFFTGNFTTQTILTIPVNQLTNSNEQLVQTLAALNNSAASLNNIQMQSMQLPVQQSGSGRFIQLIHQVHIT